MSRLLSVKLKNELLICSHGCVGDLGKLAVILQGIFSVNHKCFSLLSIV